MTTILLVYIAFGFGLLLGCNLSIPKKDRVGFYGFYVMALVWPYTLYFMITEADK